MKSIGCELSVTLLFKSYTANGKDCRGCGGGWGCGQARAINNMVYFSTFSLLKCTFVSDPDLAGLDGF